MRLSSNMSFSSTKEDEEKPKTDPTPPPPLNDVEEEDEIIDMESVGDMKEIYNKYMSTAEDVIEAAKNSEVVGKVESVVVIWCKYFEKVLSTSATMREEDDTMGPYAELLHWRNLMLKMNEIIQQVNQLTVQYFIQVLVHSKSRVVKRWKDVDARITQEFHEAKDNVRYMYALEKFLNPLYSADPPGMIEHINSLMYVIRTIHTTSRYYNTCEKVTAFMVKISNQMIAACRRYITIDDTFAVWEQEMKSMLNRLDKCIELYEAYRGAYEATRAELEDDPDGRKFNLSVNNIFGRFEMFCERLKKIIQIVKIFDMYNPIHESHIDRLGDISQRLKDLHDELLNKMYDPLEFVEPYFDDDFSHVRSVIDEIQENLEQFMDKEIENCPTCMHGLALLERFRYLRNSCLDIDGKSWYLFQFYHNEIELILQIYETEKNETPIPRGYPPFAGKIAWSRHLYRRLERPMKYFEEKTNILKRDDAKPTIKLFNSTCKKLVMYEMLVHDSWVKTCALIYDALEAPMLILRGSMRQEMVLNFDPFFRQIIDEVEVMRKLGLEVPAIAQLVYYKQSWILNNYEKLKGLLERFLLAKQKIPQEWSVLIRPLLKKVEKSFMPGVTNINWASLKIDEYLEYINVYIVELESAVNMIQETMNDRINQLLYDISHTMMIDFPEDRPMKVEEYMESIRTYGASVARNLEKMSRSCEVAVIELINMLLKTCEMASPPDNPTVWLILGPLPTFKESEMAVEKPPVDPAFTPVPMSKEEQYHIYEECRNVFAYYNQKCIEALQKTTRTSLDIVRQRAEEPQVSKRNQAKALNRIPLFSSDLIFLIPIIQLKPSLNEMQQILNQGIALITECLKYVVIWGQNRDGSGLSEEKEKRKMKGKDKEGAKKEGENAKIYHRMEAGEEILMGGLLLDPPNPSLKNCFKPVMDYKDISKMILMMRTVALQAKQSVQNLINQYYSHYEFLWKETRDHEIKLMLDKDPVITEVGQIMRGYNNLRDEIEGIQAVHRIGPLEIITKPMKEGFLAQVAEWKDSLCRQMNDKYRLIGAKVSKLINESKKDIETPLRDMNDFKFVTEVIANIREKQFTIEATMRSVEECYSFLQRQSYSKVSEEDSTRAETVRLDYNAMIASATDVQSQILKLQDTNKKLTIKATAELQQDVAKFKEKYAKNGPTVEGLDAQTASDRLFVFQDEFDELWERYEMYKSAEKLFGMIPTEYPDLMKLQKELATLQKLYGLYNDVTRAVDNFYDIKWPNLKMTKIKHDLLEFQKRSEELPKALRKWAAYDATVKTLENFITLCPLLDLMTNKAMSDRHWEQISDIVGKPIPYDDPLVFKLKHVMESPLRQNYELIEDVSIGAQEQKKMHILLQQLAAEWTIQALAFAPFKDKGDLCLHEEETKKIMAKLDKSIQMVQSMLANKYKDYFKMELQQRLQDYSKTLTMMDTWLKTQELWIRLEQILFGEGIARRIPSEAERFQNCNRKWIEIMQRARESSLVMSTCIGDEYIGAGLSRIRDQLEVGDRAVMEYLENEAMKLAEAAAKGISSESSDED